jgi:methyl-accepting chemotaxis protein
VDQKVTAIIEHIAKSHQEMANILEAKRHIAVTMSQIISAIPDVNMSFSGLESTTEYSMGITENISSYLNSLAEFEESIAENLSYVMKEMTLTEEE